MSSRLYQDFFDLFWFDLATLVHWFSPKNQSTKVHSYLLRFWNCRKAWVILSRMRVCRRGEDCEDSSVGKGWAGSGWFLLGVWLRCGPTPALKLTTYLVWSVRKSHVRTIATICSTRCKSKPCFSQPNSHFVKSWWWSKIDRRQRMVGSWALESSQWCSLYSVRAVTCANCLFVPSTLVSSEEMDSEEILAWIGMVLNTETFLNSYFWAKLELREHKATHLQITKLEEPWMWLR